MRAGRAGAAVVVLVMLALLGCSERSRAAQPPQVSSGDAEIGRQLIVRYGCGGCHRIPGVDGANGLVGPPLDSMGARSFIAGELPNNQDNMVRWITAPRDV